MFWEHLISTLKKKIYSLINFQTHNIVWLTIVIMLYITSQKWESEVFTYWSPSPTFSTPFLPVATTNLFYVSKRLLLFLLEFNLFIETNIVSFCCTTCESAIYKHILPPSWAFLPLSLLGHWAELPVLYSGFLLALYFTYGSVYMSMLLS